MLGPIIRELNAEPAEGLPPADVTLLVGLCRGDSADSVALEIKPTGEVQVGKVNSPVVYPTASLVEWTQNTLMKRGDVFGAKLQGVNQIIGLAKSIIESAVVAEGSLKPVGCLMECGGAAEVVLVEPVGARIAVPASP